jgi:phosphate transport system substrate-binding protein
MGQIPRCLPILLALLAALGGACGPAGGRGAPGEGVECAPVPKATGWVIAGSGSNITPMRALLRAWRPGEDVQLPESLGTGGAVAALVDGAIDIGLASRPLSEAERATGVKEHPLARSPIGLLRQMRRAGSGLTLEDLIATLDGEPRAWADGTPVTPLLREKGDSGARVVAAAFPALGAAMERARQARRWPVLWTDQEMADALVSVDGAVGFLDLGIVRLDRLPLSEVRIGRDLLAKQLALLTHPRTRGRDPRTEQLLYFAAGQRAEGLLIQAGYLPAVER